MCVWCVAAFCVLTVLGHFKSRIETTTTRETFEFEQKEKASFHAVRFLKWLLARGAISSSPLLHTTIGFCQWLSKPRSKRGQIGHFLFHF